MRIACTFCDIFAKFTILPVESNNRIEAFPAESFTLIICGSGGRWGLFFPSQRDASA
jgi:hypothetical protein